jgi:hypothetical protein
VVDKDGYKTDIKNLYLEFYELLPGGAYLDFEVTLSYNFDEGEISYPPTHFQLRILKTPPRPPQ